MNSAAMFYHGLLCSHECGCVSPWSDHLQAAGERLPTLNDYAAWAAARPLLAAPLTIFI
jgi:hypothetical protein